MTGRCRSGLAAARFCSAVLAATIVTAIMGAVLIAGGCDGASESPPDTDTVTPALRADAAPPERAEAPTDSTSVPPEPVSGAPTLLDLGADKCVPCKMMAPILDELRDTYEGELSVVFIDVWKNRDVAREYSVSVIPTQIFLDAEGTELFRHQGYYSREDILAKWKELGYTFKE